MAVALSPFSWPNLDTPHASQLLSCRIYPSLWRRGISPPSQMSRLLVMSMEPCAAWRLRRFESFFCEYPFDVMCQCGLLKYHHPKTKRIKIKIKTQEKRRLHTVVSFSPPHASYTSKPKPKSNHVQYELPAPGTEGGLFCSVWREET